MPRQLGAEAQFDAAVAATYDAALGAASWSEAAALMAAAVQARTATIWAGNPRGGGIAFAATHGIPDDALRAFQEHWHRHEPWMIALDPPFLGAIHHGHAIVPEEELRRTAYFNEFVGPLGIHQLLTGPAPAAPGFLVGLGLHRPFHAPRFTEAEARIASRLLDHLRRAGQIHRRLAPAAEAGDPPRGAALDALAALPEPVLLADGAGRLRFANPAAERLLAGTRSLRILGSADGPVLAAADARLRDTLAALVSDAAAGGPGGTLLLPAPPPPAAPLGILVAPMQRPAPGEARPALAMLLLAPLLPPQLDARAMTRLFGLTPAESEVALDLVQGLTAEQIAARRGVSPGTVRTQIRVVLDKTGGGTLREMAARLASQPALRRR